MKIGILTLYDAFNYGGFLQAFAMQEFLKEQGHEVYMLKCANESLCYKLKYKYISKNFKKMIIKNKQRLAYSKQMKLLNLVKYTGQHLDAVIVGSDEVWNIKSRGFIHLDEYFGEGLNTDKLIAYAPSIGFCGTEEFLKADKTRRICNFDYVFARDENTKFVCEKILNKKVAEVCDPTLLCYDTWENYIKENKYSDYVLYYSYGDRGSLKEYAIRFARENGLKLLSVGFNYDWCDKSLFVPPTDYVSLIANARYVITSTFHGSVFLSMLKKAAVIRPSGAKVRDYLKRVNMEENIFEDSMGYEAFKAKLTAEHDYASTDAMIRKMRDESIALLSDALK